MHNKSEQIGSVPTEALNVLLVEDNRDDAELCARALKKGHSAFRLDVVCTREELERQLSAVTYDIVLADYNLGPWTGVDACNLVRSKGLNIPFILITGALGEEKAVECVKAGIADYILKDRLERLPLAISRALEEQHLRDENERAERSLRESEVKFRTLAEATPAACFLEQRTVCNYVNQAAERLTGYSREELLAMNFWTLVHPDCKQRLREQTVAKSGDELSDVQYETRILTKQGETKWLTVTVGTFEVDGGLAALITAFDITHRKLTEDNMWHLASTDPLTGLANYRRLADFFQAETERSKRTGRSFGVLLLDLDGLKQINDACGHVVGNSALKRFGQALRHQCRSIDLAARFGGDEFVVVLPETGIEGPFALARRLCAQLAQEASRPALSFSFGTAVWPQDGRSFDDLLEVADRNLYAMRTKEQNQNHLLSQNAKYDTGSPDFTDTLQDWLTQANPTVPFCASSRQTDNGHKLLIS